jgi:L-threonylcarbamoyladenylate synthase
VTALTPTPEAIARAATVLHTGGLVAFPTETVYGLGADATDGRAVAGIFALKGRPAFNPLIVHVPGVPEARALAVWGDRAAALARRFWPGPLTLVLPRAPGCPVADLATAGLDTLALRAPAHPVARALLAAFGGPIAAPSANRSGTPSATAPAHIASDYGDKAPLTLAAGAAPIGLESTIVDLTGPAPTILRPGAITAQALSAALGTPVIPAAQNPTGPKAPGATLRHYAPAAPLRLRAVEVREGEALLAFGPTRFMNTARAVSVFNLSEAGDLEEAATNLFAHLRALDATRPRAIAVMDIPTIGIGAAIAERLTRAASAPP